MSSDETPAQGSGMAPSAATNTKVPVVDPNSGRVQLTVFVAATFLSALLLFLIQPLFAKMVLPLLGGSPSVWAVALCFFQAALLAGYLYAHALTTRFPPGTAGLIHLGVIAVAFLALPITVPAGWQEPSVQSPYLWQLGLFATAIGLPFVAMAANAPLLQAWFARTGHAHASDPYFMYAASNLGSMIALIGYPILLEPLFGTRLISYFWSAGFVLLWIAIGLVYLQVRSAPRLAPVAMPSAHASTFDSPVVKDAESSAGPSGNGTPTWLSRASWVGLAFVPSALLTAVTTHIATDVASAPLLWVIPLTLFLLTFVLVFRAKPLIPTPIILWLHLAVLLVALLGLAQTHNENWLFTASTGVAAFFLSAMVAHRTLYESRPPASHLTEFYLWMATGGVLGGIFAALIAPQIFSEVFEYPVLLALTMACRPDAISAIFSKRDEWLKLWLVAAAGLLLVLLLPRLTIYFGFYFWGWGPTLGLAVIFAIATLAFYRWPARQFTTVALICMAIVTLPSLVKRGAAERSFFGVYRVMTADEDKFKILLHGTTLHGAQRIRDDSGALVHDTTPTTYYYPAGPMGSIVSLVHNRTSGRTEPARFGIVGLGTGSLACLAKPNQRWKFFEIDPLVVKIASRAEDFSYLKSCPPLDGITLGDARLTLAKEPDGLYDLLVIDAFSSDAIPVHLMTKEALELYARKLKPDGILVLHISNRYLDLVAVVAATAKLVPDLHGFSITDDVEDDSYDALSTTVAVLTKDAKVAAQIDAMETSSNLEESQLRGWTDDYSDILRPILSNFLE